MHMWQQTTDRFVSDYLEAQPSFAAQAGRHEFDGRLPDLSPTGLQREMARLHAERDRLLAVNPDQLDRTARFDRAFLLHVVNRQLYWMETARFPYTNPSWYVDVINPGAYLNRNYAPLETRLKAFLRYARQIPQVAQDIEANLQGPLPKPYVELGISVFGGFADFFQHSVPQAFAPVGNPELQRQLKEVDAQAASAMASLRDFLKRRQNTATAPFALGSTLYAAMLKDTENVELPIAQIRNAGMADLDRNTNALKVECAAFLPHGTLRHCIGEVAREKPADGTLAAARRQLTMLREFILSHHVVSIPSPDLPQVAEAPPYHRENDAFIEISGPFEAGVMAVYNISPPDPKWSKADQLAYLPSEATLMSTSVHEVWPGHFLQALHAHANPDWLQKIWGDYGFEEGWAHYCEEMMIEMGLGEGEHRLHIGQLRDALLRDVRLLASIGLHTEGWTEEQAEQMFREKALVDPGTARQQAARGTFDPGYLNYTLGKLMLRKLRSDWVAVNRSASGPTRVEDQRTLWQSFHDKLLAYGAPPIPLLREELLGKSGDLL